ncbi:MAG: Eco57I restriction-modification methylase domain-containing protein, partial [Bacteroidetes bacterium]|nr:Eco57I restriction-modification methylase domain-containing protein [Bacteroidota bacterium]
KFNNFSYIYKIELKYKIGSLVMLVVDKVEIKNINDKKNKYSEIFDKKSSINSVELEAFHKKLNLFIEEAKKSNNERQTEDAIKKFLSNTFYADTQIVPQENKIDYVIKSLETGIIKVIIEVKSRTNTNEFIENDNFNKKAFHELIRYFYNEVNNNNKAISNLIASNGLEWYVFEGADIYNNFSSLYKKYKGAKYANSAEDFYKDAEIFINNNDISLKCIHLDLSDINENSSKNIIYKIYNLFSPRFLLEEIVKRDANDINKNFYKELLHIIGLEEVKDGSSSIVIKRKGRERGRGSLIELAISKLEYRLTKENVENIAFELCITWINRLLFIKLLEVQICKYKEENKTFLNLSYLKNFNDLETLFFGVLGTSIIERNNGIKQKYPQVPYLNSSLFEFAELEKENNISIGNLDSDCVLPFFAATSLHDEKRSGRQLNTLEYLLAFLDSYDFGSKKDNVASDKIINASILGRIFEKLNGYKDGAFFTPSNITTYMSREALERVVIQKFNTVYNFECTSLIELYNELNSKENIKKIKDYNNTFNSIRICDPAVGSGHFLVSVLNELIRIKAELNILCDAEQKKFSNYDFNIEDDEIVIREAGKELHYNYKDKESQRMQETLFREKRTLIENCLFGVDLNPNSVNICRLRLWIELLKNAYYKKDTNYTELETLPNIDINIKQGDSLFNKLDLNTEPKNNNIKQQFSLYREQVKEYKNTKNKYEKNKILKTIREIKQEIHKEIDINTDAYIKYNDAKSRLDEINNQLFNTSITKKEQKEIKILQEIIDKYEQKQKYSYSFEWRIEFPEVLDNDGNYEGFDLIIGNPPYIQLQKNHGELGELYKDSNYEVYDRMGDIYSLFYELGIRLLKPDGFLIYITSNKWMKADYGKSLRKYLLHYNVIELIDLGSGVFDTATVDTNILLVKNSTNNSNPALCYDYQQGEYKNLDNNIPFIYIDFPKDGSIWLIESEMKREIKKKVILNARQIKDRKDIKIVRGVLTGYNDAFIIDKTKRDEILKNCRSEDERKKTDEIIRPVLRGKDVKHYSIEYKNLYL